MGDVLVDIVTTCLDMVKEVRDFYAKLSKYPQDPKLRAFWQAMSQEKLEHMGFFHKLSVFAKQGMIPQVFSKPFKLVEELGQMKKRLSRHLERDFTDCSPEEFFVSAFYAEYYLVHESFAMLLQMGIPKVDKTPAADYELHLARFVRTAVNTVDDHPLPNLLAENLEKMWTFSRLVAEGNLADSLTGVLNRQGFFQKVSSWLELMARENKTFAVFIVDIDHMRAINESFDSKTGDKVICYVAKQLESVCRRYDLLGRYSGEEFIIFLPAVDRKDLDKIAARFLKSIIEKTRASKLPVDDVSVSIGGVYGNIRGRDIMQKFQRFIESAETLLLHKVKKAGGKGYALLRLD